MKKEGKSGLNSEDAKHIRILEQEIKELQYEYEREQLILMEKQIAISRLDLEIRRRKNEIR